MAIKQTAGRPQRGSAEVWHGPIEEWKQSGFELVHFCQNFIRAPNQL